MNLRPKTQKDFDNILDTFSGADGGIGFMGFRCLMEDMDAKAAKGDAGAAQVVAIMEKFSKLLDIAKSLK